MCFNNCDLATPGSPMRQTWRSPRMRMPSLSERPVPPTICSSSTFLMSSWPQISGAIELASREYTLPS